MDDQINQTKAFRKFLKKGKILKVHVRVENAEKILKKKWL